LDPILCEQVREYETDYETNDYLLSRRTISAAVFKKTDERVSANFPIKLAVNR
jgi:hypothetical protein